MKNKHMSLEDRCKIEKGLNNNESFKSIANEIGKNCTTISREIRNHYTTLNKGAYGRRFNDCLNRGTCPFRHKCKLNECISYEKETCPLLNKPPYVCNGCDKKKICTLSKRIYEAVYSNQEYKDNLKESRQGVYINQNEIDNINSILVPLINEQKQSIHHVLVNNKNKIMHSEKTIYNYIDSGILKTRNYNLPRKIKFRTRRTVPKVYKVDKNCLVNRRYEDFEKYMEEHTDTPIVEMDSVEGVKGGKVLLTIHFVNCSFMLAFIREHNDAQSVIDVFNYLQSILGIDKFKELFVVILTDNGSEFSNPTEIEFDPVTGEKRTQIFYCHPSHPEEKGSCEVNHELIRRIIEKGKSFDSFNQEDINLMMSHINSYKRKKLNNLSPLELFSTIYGKETIDKLGLKYIEPNNINISSKLLKK